MWGDRSLVRMIHSFIIIIIDTHITNRQLIEEIQRIRTRQLEEIAKEASQVTVRPEV